MPKNFNIVQLLSKITSWVISLLRQLPVKEQYKEKHKTTMLGRGPDGQNIANLSGYEKTTSLTTSQNLSKQELLELSPWLYVIQSAISHVVSSFRMHGRPNPTPVDNN